MRARVLLWALNAPENSSFAPFLAPQLTIPRVWREGGGGEWITTPFPVYIRSGGRRKGWFAKGSTHGYAETKPPLKMIKAKSVRQRVARFFLFHRVACLNVAVFVPCKCMHACMHECIHTRMHARLSPAIVPSVVFVRIRTPYPVPIPYLSFHSAQENSSTS